MERSTVVNRLHAGFANAETLVDRSWNLEREMAKATTNGKRTSRADEQASALAENVNAWCEAKGLPLVGRAKSLSELMSIELPDEPTLDATRCGKILKGDSRGTDATLALLAKLMGEPVSGKLRVRGWKPPAPTSSVVEPVPDLRKQSAMVKVMPLLEEARHSTPDEIGKLAESIAAADPKDQGLVAFMLLWYKSI